MDQFKSRHNITDRTQSGTTTLAPAFRPGHVHDSPSPLANRLSVSRAAIHSGPQPVTASHAVLLLLHISQHPVKTGPSVEAAPCLDMCLPLLSPLPLLLMQKTSHNFTTVMHLWVADQHQWPKHTITTSCIRYEPGGAAAPCLAGCWLHTAPPTPHHTSPRGATPPARPAHSCYHQKSTTESPSTASSCRCQPYMHHCLLHLSLAVAPSLLLHPVMYHGGCRVGMSPQHQQSPPVWTE